MGVATDGDMVWVLWSSSPAPCSPSPVDVCLVWRGSWCAAIWRRCVSNLPWRPRLRESVGKRVGNGGGIGRQCGKPLHGSYTPSIGCLYPYARGISRRVQAVCLSASPRDAGEPRHSHAGAMARALQSLLRTRPCMQYPSSMHCLPSAGRSSGRTARICCRRPRTSLLFPCPCPRPLHPWALGSSPARPRTPMRGCQ